MSLTGEYHLDLSGPGNGRQKFFIASDHVTSPLYRAFATDDLFDLVVRRGLHFDQTRQTGVIFHMMSALAECGSVDLTAVGDSHAEAETFDRKAVAALDEEAAAAMAPRSLPPLPPGEGRGKGET
jgi:hypothetical protein